MSVELTSTGQADIQEFLPEVRDLIRRKGFVLVSGKKLQRLRGMRSVVIAIDAPHVN
jgi:hypothetical protein